MVVHMKDLPKYAALITNLTQSLQRYVRTRLIDMKRTVFIRQTIIVYPSHHLDDKSLWKPREIVRSSLCYYYHVLDAYRAERCVVQARLNCNDVTHL